jgi:hypothetical protein
VRGRALIVVLTLVVLASGCRYIGDRGPRVFFAGDSMGAQADQQIVNRLTRDFRLFRYSRERATTPSMVEVVRSVMESEPRPEIAIIELGSGDANRWHDDARMRRSIRRVLDLLRPVPCVRWLNLKIGGVNPFYQGYVARADDFNRILVREIRDYDNAGVAPYRQWANQHPQAFKADGLHHTARGKTQYAAFINGAALSCPP